MKFWTVLFLILVLSFSVLDCYWTSLRGSVEEGTRTGAGVSSFDRKLLSFPRRWSKFTLMPLLLAFYLCASASRWPFSTAPAASGLVIAALIFGWIGDTTLELGNKYFLVGTASFLIGHVLYMIRFLSPVPAKNAGWAWLILIPAAVYIAFMCQKMWNLPGIAPLRAPLLLYAAALSALAVCAFLRITSAPAFSVWLTFAGACMFILSDSLLAFRRFMSVPVYLEMPTYLLAQFLICLGMLCSRGL